MFYSYELVRDNTILLLYGEFFFEFIVSIVSRISHKNHLDHFDEDPIQKNINQLISIGTLL